MPVTLFTLQDAVVHALDFIGDNVTEASALRDAKRAVREAYRSLTNSHSWTYFYRTGRITLSSPYSTGTIDFDLTGGAYERMVTLASGTWPDWAAQGTLKLSNICYAVAERKSSTIITLEPSSAPAADVASGTSYQIFRDSYPLPSDFLEFHNLQLANAQGCMTYTHPQDWLEQRSWQPQTGRPYLYTVQGSEDHHALQSLRIFPAADTTYYVDFTYKRAPRRLSLHEYTTGTATTSSGSTTITGTSTVWSQALHAGSVLRLSSTSTDAPTGFEGANQATYERIVTEVASATSLTVDSSIPATLSGVKYSLSDPIDIDPPVMLTAYLRGIECQLALVRIMESRGEIEQSYAIALRGAKAADARNAGARSAYGPAATRRWWRGSPGSDT